MRNFDWVGGAVVVAGWALGFGALIGYGVWDVVRQYHHDPGASTGALSVTASNWFTRFIYRHPFVFGAAMYAAGSFVSHVAWPQVIHS